MSRLDPARVPEALVRLLPSAEQWGIGDDYDRDLKVYGATREELERLIHSIDGINDEDLYGWLSGPESFNKNPSAEYLAMTCLTMAIDLAKVRLKKWESE